MNEVTVIKYVGGGMTKTEFIQQYVISFYSWRGPPAVPVPTIAKEAANIWESLPDEVFGPPSNLETRVLEKLDEISSSINDIRRKEL